MSNFDDAFSFMSYNGPDRRSRADRRDGYERRERVNAFERRQRPFGRRDSDEVAASR